MSFYSRGNVRSTDAELFPSSSFQVQPSNLEAETLRSKTSKNRCDDTMHPNYFKLLLMAPLIVIIVIHHLLDYVSFRLLNQSLASLFFVPYRHSSFRLFRPVRPPSFSLFLPLTRETLTAAEGQLEIILCTFFSSLEFEYEKFNDENIAILLISPFLSSYHAHDHYS